MTCDEDLVRAKARKPLVIDLAHRSETVSLALAKLDAAVSQLMGSGTFRSNLADSYGDFKFSFFAKDPGPGPFRTSTRVELATYNPPIIRGLTTDTRIDAALSRMG